MFDKKPNGRGYAKTAGKFALKAVDTTVDVAAGAVSSVLKLIGTVLLILLLAGLLFSLVFAYYVKTCLSLELDISLDDYKLNESSTIWVQNSSGSWEELITLSGKQKRIWVDYEDIPWYMEKALVAIEDKRFYEHKGVDWYRTAGAFVEMFATMQNSYGGSTITQQLIKNLTGKDEITVMRKLTEIFGALELEKKYDKREIVEFYLNAVYFGEGCYGVQTAAQTYFGKDVSELTLAQCASIVGITNLPTYYDPFYSQENNRERRETILREMYEQGYIDYAMYKEAVEEDVESTFVRTPEEEIEQVVYTYYEEVVIDDVISDLMVRKGCNREAASQLLYNGGYQIYCCLNPDVQYYIDSVYTDESRLPATAANGKILQSAIVIMDPYDGRVLGLSGGVGQKTQNFPLNRATGTYRSPGSSIKPIASYGPAVDLGYITPNTLVNDSPYLSLNGTSWYPSNDGGNNLGVVTIKMALQYSLNTVAAQIVDKIGPETSFNYLTTKLGVTSLVPDDQAYAPMALGQFTYGITVREMAAAYCSFVNDGIFTKSRTYTLVTDSAGNIVIDNQPETTVAFKPNTAHVMTYMLQNAVEAGTGTEAALWTMPVAGKTGTSTDYKDRWFVGCTPYYVAAVWTGYDTPAYVAASGNPAARIWKSIMQPLHEGLQWVSFPYPYIGDNTGIFDIYDNKGGGSYDEDAEYDGIITNHSGGTGESNYNSNNDYGGGSGNASFSFG